MALCFGIAGCSQPAPKSLISLSPEAQKIVLIAQNDLQQYEKTHGQNSEEFVAEFNYFTLQIIELYRAERPNTPMVIDPKSPFGEIILKYSPLIMKTWCADEKHIDLDCIVQRMSGGL